MTTMAQICAIGETKAYSELFNLDSGKVVDGYLENSARLNNNR